VKALANRSRYAVQMTHDVFYLYDREQSVAIPIAVLDGSEALLLSFELTRWLVECRAD